MLVTGASGFIGKHLCEALWRSGAQVCACRRAARASTAQPEPALNLEPQLSGIEFRDLDVREGDSVDLAVRQIKPDVIFHLAGKPGGGRTPEAFVEQYETTLGGAVNVAVAAMRHKIPHMVHIGSSEEYGDGPTPFQEGQPERPISAYSAAKIAATQFFMAAARSRLLSATVLRLMVVYGPGQEGSMLIPQLFASYLWGRPAKLSPGDQSRDFVYIADVIAALLSCGLRPDLSGEVFNVGLGRQHQVKDAAKMVADLCDYHEDLGLGQLPYRNPEVMCHCASLDKVQEMLGWQPTVQLAEGLKLTLAWWVERKGRRDG